MKFLKQPYTKYALMMVGVVIFCLGFMELTGQNESFDKSPLVAFWTFIAPAIIWFFGLKDKKKRQKNILTFKDGLKESFRISFVFGVISPFVFALYYIFFNPAILSYVRTAYGLTSQPDTFVILVDMAVQFVSALIFGTLYGAIITFFLRTKRKK